MKKYSKLFLAAVLGVPVIGSGAMADPVSCTQCDLQGQEGSRRDEIKADRAKYDRENDKAQESAHRDQIKADRTKYDRENDKARESSHREQIKADRANDRENEKAIAHPWDAVKDGKPFPEKTK